MQLDTAKGMRDILPKEALYRENIVATMQAVFQRYGFVALDTPIVERYDVLSAKFAAGEESDAMSETYTLKDNGDRELGLRFDLTVPLARYVGMNRTIKMPFKRYQIGKVYRDAPIKLGRYREFTQCDVDIVGSKSLLADATCIQIALEIYGALSVDAIIGVNNRKFLTTLFVSQGIAQDKVESAMMSIDKLDKQSVDAIIAETTQKGLPEDAIRKIIDLLSLQGTNEEKIEFFTGVLGKEDEGLAELKTLLAYFPDDARVRFVPTLARGLGYYTGTVFEVYSKDRPDIGAISAGGRYDNLIAGYLGSAGQNTDRAYPAVGISFGLDRIVDVLNQLDKLALTTTTTKLFIAPIGTQKESFAIAQQFRDAGINTDIDMMNRGPSKNFAYADSVGIPFVLVIGENELRDNIVTLKDLRTGNEEKLTVADAIVKINAEE
jgi:histidyl-tRNA synthetase